MCHFWAKMRSGWQCLRYAFSFLPAYIAWKDLSSPYHLAGPPRAWRRGEEFSCVSALRSEGSLVMLSIFTLTQSDTRSLIFKIIQAQCVI